MKKGTPMGLLIFLSSVPRKEEFECCMVKDRNRREKQAAALTMQIAKPTLLEKQELQGFDPLALYSDSYNVQKSHFLLNGRFQIQKA